MFPTSIQECRGEYPKIWYCTAKDAAKELLDTHVMVKCVTDWKCTTMEMIIVII